MLIIKGMNREEEQHLFYEEGGGYICSTLNEDMAKNIKTALEKQIPLEPQAITNNQDTKIGNVVFKEGTTIYKCKRCHVFISKTNRYCPHCGQKIASEKEGIGLKNT